MDPQTGKKNNKKIIYGAVLLIMVIMTCILIASGINKERARSEVTRPSAVNTASVEIAPRSGGSIPTKIPAPTPTPLIGMESPLFCKLEMAMIHNKAEKLGISGMLITDRMISPQRPVRLSFGAERSIPRSERSVRSTRLKMITVCGSRSLKVPGL